MAQTADDVRAALVAEGEERKGNAEFSDQQDLTVPNGLECPITSEIMRDPVIAADGHSYERKAIEQWIRTKGGINVNGPLTNERLAHLTLTPNHSLKKAIASWVAQRPIIKIQIRTVIKRDEDYEYAVKLYIEQQEAYAKAQNDQPALQFSRAAAQVAQIRREEGKKEGHDLKSLEDLLKAQHEKHDAAIQRKASYDKKLSELSEQQKRLAELEVGVTRDKKQVENISTLEQLLDTKEG